MTPFAGKVYRIVARIPLGQVRTYAWVARRAGRPGAGRAVGQILKRNPWPGVIPCHRVVRADRQPGGYVFGTAEKIRLLEKEREILRCLGNSPSGRCSLR